MTRIGQWNVRTLREASRLAQIEKVMTSYKINILGISEMRWNNSGEFTTNNGNTVLFSGKDTGGESGVGILIGKQIRNTMDSWKPVCDRIILARFRSKIRHITIVQCYAPTEDAEPDKKEEFYTQLTSTLQRIHKKDIVILMGDLNAKVGTDNTGVRNIMGKHGLGVKNNNGDRLIELCQTFGLVICGTIFPHKDIHKYTWTSPNGRTRNQIDHICISGTWRNSITDVRNRRGADIDSDHELLTGDFKIKLYRKKPYNNKRKRFNTSKLQNAQTANNFASTLREKLPPDQDHTWNNIMAKLQETAEETIGFVMPERKTWISDETWDLINKRRIMKQLTNTDTGKQQYRTLAKQVKKAARKDKRKFFDMIASQAEQHANQNNMRELHRLVNQLTNRKSNTAQPIRDTNGDMLTNTEAQTSRWKKHFEAVSNSQQATNEDTHNEAHSRNRNLRISIDPPNISEIKEAIKNLKRNKAAGIDGIPAELLQADVQTTAQLLQPHITSFWLEERASMAWKKGLIVKLPKKGDLTYCDNWRGITLLNLTYKILTGIIQGRIQAKIEKTIRDEQAGFRPHRSCVDQANTLRIIVEQSIEYRTPLYIIFIDFKKAFDTIKRDAIWKALIDRGTPEKIVRLIQALYDNAELAVLHKGQISSSFTTTSGVKQGCPLSPLLFTVVLDNILNEVCSTKRGITWGLTKQLEDLEYADDICLLSHKLSDIQSKLNHLEQLALHAGLEINLEKTKAMRINNTNTALIQLKGQQVEFVNSFCYLGSIISTSGGAHEDVEHRLKKARAAFGRLQPLWRNSQISRKTKLRIFRACVKTILTYGSETWLVTNSLTNKLQVFVNKCLRIICRIFWPNTIPNEGLWILTGEEPIAKQIRRRKWKWIGHTLRKPNESITRMALEWNPQGTRRRGRPNITWRRTIQQEMTKCNISWDDIKISARNRVRWRCQVEVLCSQEE